jgi:hypothetical protein
MRHPTVAEQYAGWCVHFDGLMHDECKAGVKYETVKQRSTEPSGRLAIPCIKRDCLTNCALAQYPTQQEAEAHEREQTSYIAHMLTAREGIVEQTGGKRGVSGTVTCPKCLGVLRYAVARSNGHVRALCETEGCLSWME